MSHQLTLHFPASCQVILPVFGPALLIGPLTLAACFPCCRLGDLTFPPSVSDVRKHRGLRKAFFPQISIVITVRRPGTAGKQTRIHCLYDNFHRSVRTRTPFYSSEDVDSVSS